MIQVARSRRVLGRCLRRSCPRGIREIEEFGHIHLRGISLGERRHIETGLNKLENRRIIRNRVGYVVLFRKR